MSVKIRLPYTHKRVNTVVKGKSKTKQSHKAECDINNILAKYQKTGALTHVQQRQPEYGFASGLDFKESCDLIQQAKELFDGLPSGVRNHFENDPASFLDYVNDPANAGDVESGFRSILEPEATAPEAPVLTPEGSSEGSAQPTPSAGSEAG